MLSRFSYKSWFWVLQPVLLLAAILYLSWYISSTPRGGFAVPSFESVFSLLLFWAVITKLPVVLIQYVLIHRLFWLESGAFVRVLLFYFTDLIGGIIAIALLWPFWVGTLFIDAGFPASLVIFPQNIVTAIALALIAPRLADPDAGRVSQDVGDPVVARLMPFAIALLALLLSFSLATTIAENTFDLFGQLLAFLPVTLLFARIYFDPAQVAAYRKPQQAIRLLFLNLVIGWTIVGWVLCLLWARLGKSTIPPVRKTLNWMRYGALAITGTGMMVTGVGISALGDALASAQVEGDVVFTGNIVVLLLCILWLSSGLRLLVRSIG